MPFDGTREDRGLLREFLRIVLAEVNVFDGLMVQGKDVVGGLQLGDGYETDLHADISDHDRCSWLHACCT